MWSAVLVQKKQNEVTILPVSGLGDPGGFYGIVPLEGAKGSSGGQEAWIRLPGNHQLPPFLSPSPQLLTKAFFMTH